MSKKKWDKFLNQISLEFNSGWTQRYIKAVQSGERKHLKKLYHQFCTNEEETRQNISKICMCLEKQHQFYYGQGTFKFKRLPMLANEVLADPHALDKSNELGRMFLHALSILQNETYAKSSLKRAEHYMYSGLIMCDISSFVTFVGLLESESDGTEINSVWEKACERKEVMQVPLRNIMHLRSISPYSGDRIFVVENPSVFSTIMDEINTEIQCPAIICSSGYNSFALKELLRGIKISQSYRPLEVWYSGDYDPEGLYMAQILIDELGDTLKLWRYSESDYDKSSSFMPNSDLKKRKSLLKSLKNNDLIRIGEKIEETKKVGYQEAVIDDLTSDVICYYSTLK